MEGILFGVLRVLSDSGRKHIRAMRVAIDRNILKADSEILFHLLVSGINRVGHGFAGSRIEIEFIFFEIALQNADNLVLIVQCSQVARGFVKILGCIGYRFVPCLGLFLGCCGGRRCLVSARGKHGQKHQADKRQD